jgi:hypothetical protein
VSPSSAPLLLSSNQLDDFGGNFFNGVRPGTSGQLVGQGGAISFEPRTGWQAATIEQVLVELQTGPFGSSLHQSDYQIGGIPVINPASIQNERIVSIDKMAVGATTLDRLATFKLRAGDIVMARRGEMGRCAVVTEREAGWLGDEFLLGDLMPDRQKDLFS